MNLSTVKLRGIKPEEIKNNKKERETLQNGKYYKTGINKGMG